MRIDTVMAESVGTPEDWLVFEQNSHTFEVFYVEFGEISCCVSCVELLKISCFGYFILKKNFKRRCVSFAQKRTNPEGCQHLSAMTV